ncbi:DUF5659 domain-containing protein [Paraliobacillus sp. X-1268]|uniref:DUF5659 domain-containing protein n=1 Tax=Paraliobacillus sp. X-1268 TaxID=2213193 RepID=UPI003519A8A8
MYVIRSMKLAGFLMQKGFVILKLQNDRNGTGRNVFLFNESTDLTNAIKEYREGA